MKHTFLFEERTWRAKGHYYDDINTPISVEGETIITHRDNIWVNDGYMKLLLDTPIELFNRYEIKPFSDNNFITSWQSINPALGILLGTFTIVNDTIMSFYKSDNDQYSGYEFLLKIDDKTYINRGVAFKDKERISSWSVELKSV